MDTEKTDIVLVVTTKEYIQQEIRNYSIPPILTHFYMYHTKNTNHKYGFFKKKKKKKNNCIILAYSYKSGH